MLEAPVLDTCIGEYPGNNISKTIVLEAPMLDACAGEYPGNNIHLQAIKDLAPQKRVLHMQTEAKVSYVRSSLYYNNIIEYHSYQ